MASSGFREHHVQRYVHLEPRWASRVRAGICHDLNSLLFKYNDLLRGVVVSYSDIELINSLGLIKDESPYLHFFIKCARCCFSLSISLYLNLFGSLSAQTQPGLIVICQGEVCGLCT
jgi:hypothetical protein